MLEPSGSHLLFAARKQAGLLCLCLPSLVLLSLSALTGCTGDEPEPPDQTATPVSGDDDTSPAPQSPTPTDETPPEPSPDPTPFPTGPVRFQALGVYASGFFAQGVARSLAFDGSTSMLYLCNEASQAVDVIDLTDPSAPTYLRSLELSDVGPRPAAVAARDGVVAVAVWPEIATDPGSLLLFLPDGTRLGPLKLGVTPGSMAFTPGGGVLVVANEGIPRDDYAIDPQGTVSLVDTSEFFEDSVAPTLSQDNVRTVDFLAFNGNVPDGVRLSAPYPAAALDFEPEAVSISSDGLTAFVTLQENNAIAVIDITSGTVQSLRAAGSRDFSNVGFDASDEDGINIVPHPVFGLLQPAGITGITIGAREYLVTANQGAPRRYSGFNDTARVADVTLDAMQFPDADALKTSSNLGRLTISTSDGDIDDDGDFDALYMFGGRSFTVWLKDGTRVYESGSELESLLATADADHFNSSNLDNQSFDRQSPESGPGPGAAVSGRIDDAPYAFVALEQQGGVVAINLDVPEAPLVETYYTSRVFSETLGQDSGGDSGPVALEFVGSQRSPTSSPLLIIGNVVSGTVQIVGLTRRLTD